MTDMTPELERETRKRRLDPRLKAAVWRIVPFADGRPSANTDKLLPGSCSRAWTDTRSTVFGSTWSRSALRMICRPVITVEDFERTRSRTSPSTRTNDDLARRLGVSEIADRFHQDGYCSSAVLAGLACRRAQRFPVDRQANRCGECRHPPQASVRRREDARGQAKRSLARAQARRPLQQAQDARPHREEHARDPTPTSRPPSLLRPAHGTEAFR